MTTKTITIERVTFVSGKTFEDVLDALGKGIGQKNFAEVTRQMDESSTYAQFQSVIHAAVGSADLMEFMRLDLGAALRRDPSTVAYKIVRIIAGNPLIMKQMTEHVPDAGSYAPVSILVYECRDGVRVSYDKMESYLASCGNQKVLQVARDLDAKVIHLLQDATTSG